jgi:hypothetical protein
MHLNATLSRASRSEGVWLNTYNSRTTCIAHKRSEPSSTAANVKHTSSSGDERDNEPARFKWVKGVSLVTQRIWNFIQQTAFTLVRHAGNSSRLGPRANVLSVRPNPRHCHEDGEQQAKE